MKRNLFIHIPSRPAIRSLILMACFFVLMMLAACASTYNSQKNWNRTPPSTGHNRCGCLLNPARENAIKLYHQTVYALQA
jgi:hypothetical protein